MGLSELGKTQITEFKGWFSRGQNETVPEDHFGIATNLRYFYEGFETRWGTSISISVPAGVRRWFPYKIEGLSDRVLYLDTNGRIYDSLYPASPILTIPNMVDFSMVVFNGRAYLSPHDRVRGLASQMVYLYQGGGVAARQAAGKKPFGFTLQATTGSQSGKIEAGTHLFAIAFETDSGFITRPGPEIFARYEAPGGTQAHISNISIGPTGTIARHILATKIIIDYNGNQFGPELFFVPNGKIEDNSSTTAEVDFYDADLVSSADYLHDVMETIPAVLGMCSYQGSLVGWGTQNDPSTVYVSKGGEPESVSLIEGGIEVDISEGGGVKNCVEYRGQLMIHKSNRTYAITNNGQEPVFWGKPTSIDRGVGTEVFGVAAILDNEGNTIDKYIIADRKGLLLFTGVFDLNLTISIDDAWKRINKLAFNTIQVALDPHNYCIYAVVPLDGANTPNTLFFGNFEFGLDPADIRWSMWTFPYGPATVGIDTDAAGKSVIKIGSLNGNLYYLDPLALTDNNVAIPNPTFETAFVGDEAYAVNYFGGVRLRATGIGILNIEAHGLDDAVIVKPPSLVINSAPGKIYQREFALSSPLASVKFYTSNASEKFRITGLAIYHSPEYAEEPG